MGQYDVRIGYNGKCAVHKTMPTIFRRTSNDMVFRLESEEFARFANIIKVHCAAGHVYLAVDLDEAIPDPFDAEATASILAEEF